PCWLPLALSGCRPMKRSHHPGPLLTMNLRRRSFAACLLILSWLGVSPAVTVSAAAALAVRNSRVQALAYHRQLAESILPYWHDTALDLTNGGYVLADDGKGGHQAREKQLVSQARLVWTFSHVHQRGFSRPGRDYP